MRIQNYEPLLFCARLVFGRLCGDKCIILACALSVAAEASDLGVTAVRENPYQADTVPENIGQARVTLLRQGDFPDSLTVRCFSSDGTARAGTHYIATSSELTFRPDDPRKTFVIPILDNGLVDGPKILNVTIENAADGAVLQQFPLTIEDNEMPAGLLDASFRPPDFVKEPLALQPDGKILVRTDDGLARLNPDGSEDSSFHPAAGIRLDPAFSGEPPIRTALVQANGKIVIAGPFVAMGGLPLSRLARLNSDGTVDPSFGAPALGQELDALVLQPDGKLLVSGRFTSIHGVQRANLARLNEDGSLDMTFNSGSGPGGIAGFFAPIAAMVSQQDGRILVAGYFSSFSAVARPALTRLNTDGSLDESFVPSDLPPKPLTALAVTPGGKVYVGGGPYTEWNKAHRNVARLNDDGTLDQAFAPVISGSGDVPTGDSSTITAITVQPDAKVLVAGYFEEVNGNQRQSLVRLNTDGSVDPEFNVGTLRSEQRRVGRIFYTAVQSDARILIGGAFVAINGVPLRGIARVLSSSPAPNTIGFARSPWPAAESDGSVEITVLRRGNSDRAVSIDYATEPIDATPGVDYVPLAGHIDFAPREVEKVIRISLQDDGVPEPDESVQVVLDHFSPGTAPDFYRSAEVRIVDSERPGSLDPGFNAGQFNGFAPWFYDRSSAIETVALGPNGAIYIGGHFSEVQGVPRESIARLNSDGSLDPTFQSGAWLDVHRIVVQQDGKILAGWQGSWTRLNLDGSVDESYQSRSGGLESDVFLIQSDGRIIAPGSERIERFLADGRPDPSFSAPAGDWSLGALQSDDQIIVAGSTVERLHADGTPDLAFNTARLQPGLEGGAALGLAVQADDKIVVVGGFEGVNGRPGGNVVRLNSDGSLDETFDAKAGLTPRQSGSRFPIPIAFQPDGKILIGGNFAHANGLPRRSIVRLNVDGSVDTQFDPGTGLSELGEDVRAIAVQPDGQILIAGSFEAYDGIPRYGVARLNGDGKRLQLRATRPGAGAPFRLVMSGPTGARARLQRSRDLRVWEDWQNVTFEPTPTELTDADAGAFPYRFYRAVGP